MEIPLTLRRCTDLLRCIELEIASRKIEGDNKAELIFMNLQFSLPFRPWRGISCKSDYGVFIAMAKANLSFSIIYFALTLYCLQLKGMILRNMIYERRIYDIRILVGS